MEKLTRKYGLLTAICMVVGTVIGSGVFFKAQDVLKATGGNMTTGIIAWAITGLLMIVCALQFSMMATKYEKISGVVDYAEATCGKGYAYLLAWFLLNIYYPAMTGVLAWVSARYLGVLFGWSIAGPEVMVLAGFLMIASYTLNTLSPKLAGKFQVSVTVIKLIPIFLMAVIGTAVGFFNGTLTGNFAGTLTEAAGGSGGLFAAIVATVFAYDGWIVATSINAELKNPKRTLPLALVIGSLVVVGAYILYFIGVGGGASTQVLIESGATTAFTNVFGVVGGSLLNVCIVISCLGTLNGLMVASTRSMYAIAARNEGPAPKLFRQVDKETNMTSNSAIYSLFVCAIWLVYFYGANLADSKWFGQFSFDSSELPIVTIYAMYIPMFISWMIKEKELGFVKRFVLPCLSILACSFMVFAAVYAHGYVPYTTARANGQFSLPVLFYLIVFAVVMVLGVFLNRKNKTLEET